ncbi:tetratricopeptide repeat protein [bacterium]|nr:tetratricopeptide repeat protein [bacterium]
MKKRYILLIWFFPAVIFAQQQKIDSLKSIIKEHEKVARIDILNKISFAYNTVFPDSGLKYSKKAIKFAKDLGYQKGIAEALQNTGVNYLAKGDLKAAYDYNKQALSIFEKLQDHVGICESLINIGLVYNSFGEKDKALGYFVKMMEIAEANKDTARIIKGYINQSLVLMDNGDNDKALEYLELAEKLDDKTGDLVNQSIVYIDLGVVYSRKQNMEEASKYYLKAEKLCKRIGNISGLITAYLNLGVIEQGKGKNKEALRYYNKAMNNSEKIGDKGNTVLIYYNIGSIYLDENKYSFALSYFEKILHLAKKTASKSDLLYAYWGFYLYYDKTGDYKTALNFIRKYDTVAAEVYSENNQKRISAIQTAYEVRKKDKEMELLKKEKAIQDMKMWRQHILLWILIIGFIIIITVSTIILRLYKYQKTINMELSYANEKIQEKENKLKKVNGKQKKILTELKEVNLTKDKFFSIIAHDIKSPLQVQLSGSRLLADRINELDKEKIKDIASELKKNTLHLFNLLENLLNWSQLQQGRMKHKPERIHLSDMVDSVVYLMSGSADQKEIKINKDISSNIFIKADPNMFKSVLQNLVSNGIKFSNRGEAVNISAKIKGENVEIYVQDSGTGIPKKLQKEIFRIDKQNSRLGTEGEKGTGLGLVLCRDFVRENRGNIFIDSKEGAGTKVTLVFSKA